MPCLNPSSSQQQSVAGFEQLLCSSGCASNTHTLTLDLVLATPCTTLTLSSSNSNLPSPYSLYSPSLLLAGPSNTHPATVPLFSNQPSRPSCISTYHLSSFHPTPSSYNALFTSHCLNSFSSDSPLDPLQPGFCKPPKRSSRKLPRYKWRFEPTSPRS